MSPRALALPVLPALLTAAARPAPPIGAATLVLHGERDPDVRAGQAHAFAAAPEAAGPTAEPSFGPGGHRMPLSATDLIVLPFLDRRLRGDATPR